MDISAPWLIAVVVLFLLNWVDVILTLSIIRQGGTEFNPLIRWIVKKWEQTGLVVFKLCIFSLIVGVSVLMDSSNAYSIVYLDFILLVVMTLMYRDLQKTPGFTLYAS